MDADQVKMTKVYRYRKLHGLKSSEPAFAQLGDPDGLSLSGLLEQTMANRLFLCGSLAQMTREYVEEPLVQGWEFDRQYIHKFRSPVYRSADRATGRDRVISVKLIGESWLPGCASMMEAIPAWQALKAEWEQATKLPLLSTPSKTGQALLWESLPKGEQSPSLPDDLARHIRSISPQHRIEVLKDVGETPLYQFYQYDGRWMYASLAGLDRLPIGEPIEVSEFESYMPGWYHVIAQVPATWNHIGLLPTQGAEGRWAYPSTPGQLFVTWASEPEITLAQTRGWQIKIYKGWRFKKGRPLGSWTKKLVEIRERLNPRAKYAGAAVREILNHTIGSLHRDTYEREGVVSPDEWRALVDAHGYGGVQMLEHLDGGLRRVVYPSLHSDRLSIYMPHWSAQIYALARARVAQWALKCDPAHLVKIHGDAIYSMAELPFEDNGNLGQLRRKS